MNALRRIGVTQRWSDVVIHGETAHFVEVAADSSLDARGQRTRRPGCASRGDGERGGGR